MNLVDRIWNGESGLAFTYWVVGIVTTVFLYFIGKYTEILLSIRIDAELRTIVLCIGMSIMFLVSIFYFISTWRAATNYTGRSLWAILAKIHVALGWIFLAKNLKDFIAVLY